MPKEKVGSKPKGNNALLDVDERIVLALAERDEASRKVSLLVYWQDRLARITADMEMLISIKMRLSGQTPVPTQPSMSPLPALGYAHDAAIPPNISSIPRQATPQPSGANVASEVENEGGFM